MADDAVDDLRLFDEGDDSHPATTCRTTKRIDLVDFPDHLCPASLRNRCNLIFNHHSWHELKACGCLQGFHKCTHRAETEIIEEFSLEAEEKTQHLRNSKDNLTVGDIEQKLLPHPLAPFLTSLRMAGGAESAGFAGKHEEALLSTVGTPDTGKTAHRIAAVEILLNNILNNRAKKAILSLKA